MWPGAPLSWGRAGPRPRAGGVGSQQGQGLGAAPAATAASHQPQLTGPQRGRKWLFCCSLQPGALLSTTQGQGGQSSWGKVQRPLIQPFLPAGTGRLWDLPTQAATAAAGPGRKASTAASHALPGEPAQLPWEVCGSQCFQFPDEETEAGSLGKPPYNPKVAEEFNSVTPKVTL